LAVYFALFVLILLWGIRFAVKIRENGFHSLVLSILAAEAVFFAASWQSISLDGRALAFCLLLAALPGAAYRCAKREEIRLPY
jgi:hypothetical protein